MVNIFSGNQEKAKLNFCDNSEKRILSFKLSQSFQKVFFNFLVFFLKIYHWVMIINKIWWFRDGFLVLWKSFENISFAERKCRAAPKAALISFALALFFSLFFCSILCWEGRSSVCFSLYPKFEAVGGWRAQYKALACALLHWYWSSLVLGDKHKDSPTRRHFSSFYNGPALFY